MAAITDDNLVRRYYRYALLLGVFTVVYNLGEGVVSIFFGLQDETLTLFGFGIDSFIECLSGLGIVAMVLRIQSNPDTPRSTFERTALRVTGASFYLLAAGLFVTAVANVILGHKPTTTVMGVIVSLISIAVMWALVAAKIRVGRQLHSCAHSCRRQLHQSLYLHVGGSAGGQPGLCRHRHRLCR